MKTLSDFKKLRRICCICGKKLMSESAQTYHHVYCLGNHYSCLILRNISSLYIKSESFKLVDTNGIEFMVFISYEDHSIVISKRHFSFFDVVNRPFDRVDMDDGVLRTSVIQGVIKKLNIYFMM